jgi:FlaA1/EpsC-like NDP-sugar epimerase
MLINRITQQSRFVKYLIMLLTDSVFLICAVLLSFSLILNDWHWPENINSLIVIFSAPIVAIPVFLKFGLYQVIIRSIGFKSIWIIVKSISLYVFIWGVFWLTVASENITYSIILINWMLSLLFISGSRVFIRWLILKNKRTSKCNNVIIYGAGSAGRQLLVTLVHSDKYNPVSFIDDNSEMYKCSIDGLKVFSLDDLEYLIGENNVTAVLLAMPSISHIRHNEIISLLEPYSVSVLSLPDVSELKECRVKITDLHEISIKDLLGRDFVAANKELLSLNILGKVVMVTGAGGSIGSELCRQILLLKPKVLILYELNEFALYVIDKELLDLGIVDIEVLSILGSINNTKRLSRIFKKFGVQTIYHAAAYKHVPMVEFNNSEGVSNNIFGTLNCAKTAISERVENFVLISTDKAVRPTNTMGATKRFAEMILQALSKEQNKTRFTMVRFGNVLESSGSVIPLFKKQIKEGGPITVTDAEIIRYFMTIPEAVELVIQAGAMGKGGDVFVLDMGKPIRISDLARKMIHLSGLQVKDNSNPNGDIEIKYIGLRPGEKLYEELLIGDTALDTDNPMIMRAQEDMLTWNDLRLILDDLKVTIDNDDQKELRKLLIKAVPEFKPQCEIKDLLYSD